MRICLVCSEYPPARHGGIGTATRQLAQELARRGHEVRVIGVYRGQRDSVLTESDGPVRVWRFREPRIPRGVSVLARLTLYRTVRRWARRDEIDVVEVPDYGGWAAYWRRLPIPVVIRLHGSSTFTSAEIGHALGDRMRTFERSSLMRGDYRCSVSGFLARRTRELFSLEDPAIAVIYHGVKLSRFTPFEDRSAKRVVFAGTLKYLKGITHLLNAWPYVREKVPNAELHLYGKYGRLSDGTPFQEALQDMLPDPDLLNVTLHGQVDRSEVLEAFRGARVAVLPSLIEGLGLTPLEAMSTGCPTIFTRRGPGPELIEHGVNGLLVEPDDPEDIADRLIEVLSSDALARRLGESGRQNVESRFSLDGWTTLNEDFFRRCVESFRKSR